MTTYYLGGGVGSSVTGNQAVGGNSSVTGNQIVGGTLTVTGLSSLNGGATINGATNITGNTAVTGTLESSGNGTIGGNLTVTGTTALNGNSVVDGTLNATGAVDFDNNLNVDGTTTLGGNTTVTGRVTATEFAGDGSNLTGIVHPTVTGAATTLVESARTYVSGLTFDGFGHVTGITTDSSGILTGAEFDAATGQINFTHTQLNGTAATSFQVDIDGRYLQAVGANLTLRTNNGLGLLESATNTLTADASDVYDLSATVPKEFHIAMTGEFNGNFTISPGDATDGTGTELGNLVVAANSTFGSDDAHVHTFRGNVVPQRTDVFDLGTTALRWRNIHVQNLATGLTQHNVPFVGANGVLAEDAAALTYTSTGAGAGTFTVGDATAGMDVDAATGNITTNGTLTVEGQTNLDGHVVLGSDANDNITFNGDIVGDLTPNVDNGVALGTLAQSFGDLHVDNIQIDGNAITSTNTNGDITIEPNGTGDVDLITDNVQIGDANANATLTTNGTGDLTLNTNNGANSGSIVIQDGANGNIALTTNGTGNVTVNRLVLPTALPATPVTGSIVLDAAGARLFFFNGTAWIQI